MAGFQPRIGNGNSSFWFDDWLGGRILCNEVLFVDTADITLQLKDVWKEVLPNFSMIRTWLPPILKSDLQRSFVLL